MMSRTGALLAAAAVLATEPMLVAAPLAPPRMVCLSEPDTRAMVEERKLIPPLRAMDAALRSARGEAVSIRLCRDDAAMIYDVAVLRDDGRLVHILIDAGSGGLVPPRPGR